jgi:glycopeptide antibiotics resistance protein
MLKGHAVSMNEQQSTRERQAARWLRAIGMFLLFVIGYGSVWPFAFAPWWQERLPMLWRTDGIMAVDALQNVAAFVPVGFVFAAAHGRGLWRDLALALLVAVALQIAQLWIPARSPALYDAFFNGLGLMTGAASVWGLRFVTRSPESPGSVDAALLLLLCGSLLFIWLLRSGLGTDMDLWRLRTDEAVAGSAPLLLQALAFGFCLPALLPWRWPALCLAGLILAGLLGAASFEMALARSLLLMAATVIGIALVPRGRTLAAAIALVAALLADGLLPWIVADQHLGLLPLRSLLVNPQFPLLSALALKLFCWSALALLLYRLLQRSLPAVAATTALVASVELAQTRLASGTPDISDILLALLAASLVTLASQQRKGLDRA